MTSDQEMMLRCLSLAKKGMGSVSPNPMVGCVIVKGSEIIGEGFHEKFGEAHAEVNAIRSARGSVEGSDVYVNLEPCSYFGKTPPCVDLLIEKKVRKVIIGMLDPNPEVNGKGAIKLRDAGIEVEVGVLADESRQLNEAFVKFITTGLPFVTLKIAQSLDGRIALVNGKSKYITSGESLKKVHSLRAEHDAILVGARTIAADNPSLTVRLAEGRSPVRIILDGNLSSPLKSKVFHDGESRVVLFHSKKSGAGSSKKVIALEKLGVEVYRLPGNERGKIRIRTLLERIARLGLASVLVEGGSEIFSEFIKDNAADKLQLFVAPAILGLGKGFADGLELKDLRRGIGMKDLRVSQIGNDWLMTGYF